MTIRRKLLNFGAHSTDFRSGFGAFSELSKLLAGAVGRPNRAFIVADSQLDEDRLVQVRHSLTDAGYQLHQFDIDTKDACSLQTFGELSCALGSAGITGEDLIVGTGPYEICSLASFAGRAWLGGISCALLPTTLDAMVRVSTQMNALACASGADVVELTPEASIVVCDLDFVAAYDVESNGLGYVYMTAAHLAESRKFWESFASISEGLVRGDALSLNEALGNAQTSRMNTVKSASPSARRAFMYGQTTARALARCLEGQSVLPCQLLAEGMRFEARLAVDVCDFSVDEMFAQDDRFEDLGIEELAFSIDPSAFIDALHTERFSRANRFQLALPKHPGIIRLASVDDETLERHVRAFIASRRP
ncbi:MAG: hypothetical protein Q4B77_03940 [Coriobacteriaceae bacterium]|nr:hypothetical protein [Coriobacteriaceae bacterium]